MWRLYFITHFGIIIGQSLQDANKLSGGAIGGITVGIFIVIVLVIVLLLSGKCITINICSTLINYTHVAVFTVSWKFVKKGRTGNTS